MTTVAFVLFVLAVAVMVGVHAWTAEPHGGARRTPARPHRRGGRGPRVALYQQQKAAQTEIAKMQRAVQILADQSRALHDETRLAQQRHVALAGTSSSNSEVWPRWPTTQLSIPGTGGDSIRDKDRAGVKTQIVGLDLGIGTGTESLMSGAMPVTDNSGSLTVDNAGTFAVQIAANSSVNVAQMAGTTTDTNSGVKSAGTQRVVLATDQPQLTNALKVDGSAVTQPVSGTVTADAPVGTPAFVRLSDGSAAITALPVTDNSGSLTVDAPVGTPVFSTPTPSATGGWSKIKYAAQTTTVQTPKGTAATFGGYYIYNPNASVAYLQVFDAATATTITLGTTVPDMIFAIPAASAANIEITCGVNMTNGVKLACTTTATGSTAPGTGLDMTIFYK
jgi:hypothetical protein